MENSVLILGAAALQVPIIKYVKQQGFNVIVVSIPGDYPGFAIADKCVYCDVRDVDSILASVCDDDIKAVLTDQTDITVPIVAILAEKLGVAGNSPKIAKIYANKYKMRQHCHNIGVCVPCFFHASTIEDVLECYNTIRYPAIMKPEDNQGSRGVFVIREKDEIISHFEETIKYSKTGYIIVEEFFKGREVVVEGFVYNGYYLNFGIAERRYFDIEDLLIPCQTIFPAKVSEQIRCKLLNAENTLHSSLNPSFGMIHSEYLINEETGEYILVETALRGGGVYISSHLVPYYSGIDNYHFLFNAALGKSISLDQIEESRKQHASAYVCFTLPSGKIVSIEGLKELSFMPSVKVCDIDDLKVGMQVSRMTNKTQRLGPIILMSENRCELEKEIVKIQNTLKIKVDTVVGVDSDIIWK